MNPHPIFISHASADDEFVKELRVFLERLGLPVWVDSRNLRGGAKLLPEIRATIEQARQVIGVFSPRTVNSGWVRREIQWAEMVAKRRQGDGYAIIPILLPGIEPSALGLWFKAEPVGVKVQVGPGGLTAAAPLLAAALGIEDLVSGADERLDAVNRTDAGPLLLVCLRALAPAVVSSRALRLGLPHRDPFASGGHDQQRPLLLGRWRLDRLPERWGVTAHIPVHLLQGPSPQVQAQ